METVIKTPEEIATEMFVVHPDMVATFNTIRFTGKQLKAVAEAYKDQFTPKKETIKILMGQEAVDVYYDQTEEEPITAEEAADKHNGQYEEYEAPEGSTEVIGQILADTAGWFETLMI